MLEAGIVLAISAASFASGALVTVAGFWTGALALGLVYGF